MYSSSSNIFHVSIVATALTFNMLGGYRMFSGSWLSYGSNGQKLSEWYKKGKHDYNGYCCLCKVGIKCDNAGKAQLLQQARKKKELSERAQREKQKLLQQKEALAKSEKERNEEEVKIRVDVEVADEMLKEATAKLNSALKTKLLNKQSVTVTQMILETATTKRENIMTQFDKIWNKQKSLDKTTHKLLDEALHGKGEPDKRGKTTAEQRHPKKVKK